MRTATEPNNPPFLLHQTQSLCPVCLGKLDAFLLEDDHEVRMLKTCMEHGLFETTLWRGKTPIQSWIREKERAIIAFPNTGVKQGCPYDCGLCEAHLQHTCTALIEVTERCNLHCRFCFADAKGLVGDEPSLENIRMRYESILRTSGACNIQLSGGEPTLRDDLPEIVRMGKELGFSFIQLNTNGIRLAQEESFVKALKEAGLSSLFLQFDGTTDEVYKILRGKPLFELKCQAIANCQKYGIGVVLVPTVVPYVNENALGEIIRFGIAHSPTVRGVHFQPVSYFGRVPEAPRDDERISLAEVMDKIIEQCEGMVAYENLQPPGCEHALCSFHGNFFIQEGKLCATTKRACCSPKKEFAEEGANKAKAFVARNWAYEKNSDAPAQNTQLNDWDGILSAISNQSFSISGMAFQDVWNVNLARIKACCIHVCNKEGHLIPFCAYNLTSTSGVSLYREGV